MRVVVIFQNDPRVVLTGLYRVELLHGTRYHFVDVNENRTPQSWNRAKHNMMPFWPGDIWPEENAQKVIELMQQQNIESAELLHRHYRERFALKGQSLKMEEE